MLTLKRLKELLHYDPETGIWTWLVNRRRAKKGMIAGTIRKDGYVKMSVDGKQYLSHQLVWFYTTGTWVKEIDHADRNSSNNRWNNLRKATRSQNNANSFRQNSSGHKGINRVGSRWRVRVNKHHIGYFNTFEQAVKSQEHHSKIVFGEFATC